MSSISVLMSVYKSEKADYLDRSLLSVWDDQTLKPNEIVLVEDGPLTDSLLSVIKKWEDKLGNKLIILINDQNIGLTKSLNRGIEIINSDYIARMDSDDISLPDRFKIQSEYLDTHPDIFVVGGSLQEFDGNNDCLNLRHYPLSPELARKYIHKASPLAHPTVMMRRKIFESGLKYNERYRTSQDIALWFDVLYAGFKIANVSSTTIKFRRDEDVFKRRGRGKSWNEFKIYIHGIWKLDGLFTFKYIYPISRLGFRLMPQSIIKYIYGSNIRKRILE